MLFSFFFFNDPATTEIYTLSLHDALPISPLVAVNWRCQCMLVFLFVPMLIEIYRTPLHERRAWIHKSDPKQWHLAWFMLLLSFGWAISRSEEHTSELQSHVNLVCRLLLEK